MGDECKAEDEAGKFHRCDQLLGVSVHVGMEHEATEGGPDVKGQRLVHHAQEDELHVQLLGDLIDGQILAVQTHACKELQLVSEGVHNHKGSFAFYSCHGWGNVQYPEISSNSSVHGPSSSAYL
ncbi:hypothetical protein EYF80_054622 [Liparis tanakae]|uniref:Uncharacterized protein n=1 Tax=Liparis tanakae TaxID=230148 RepID=A0A4Z2F2U1_9TELE|nr:hypothetical protein EYF80_054622 [Liparis tanakae]